MNRTAYQHANRRDGGYVLVAMMALIAALLGTGAAFMQWASDEAQQSQKAEAAMQAYYVAQTGVIEKGLDWLNHQQAGILPRTDQPLGGGSVPGVGRYRDVLVAPVFGSLADPNNFSFSEKYRISAVGEVDVPWWDSDGDAEMDTVERKAVMYVQVRSFVDYMYLTNYETSITFPGDIIRFFGRDTLWGRTHSNDWIATQNVNGLPVFYDIVSTTKPSFHPSSPNPAGQFRGGPPRFNAAPVLLPELADPIRAGATAQGRFYFEEGMEWRGVIDGTQAIFYYYPEGTEFDTIVPPPNYTVDCAAEPPPCVFIDGKLDLKGVMDPVNCEITIGCSQDIRLIDDVMLSGTNPVNGDLPAAAMGSNGSIIGIVSEKWILIANTWENGRENRTGQTADHADIVITAAFVALRGSFQFEQMNDVGDNYIGPNPDERGNIVLTGSNTQWNRGYVHRSNNGGTGYNKVYHYDFRFKYRRPPCFLGATDDLGRALFNIVQWGQASEDPVDMNRTPPLRVRYN